MKDLFLKLGRLINQANNVLIIAHSKPDGDTLGSANSLALVLKNLGKKAQIACVDQIPYRYWFLSELQKAVNQFQIEDYDLIFMVDTAESYMSKFTQIYPNLLNSGKTIINIDHHSSNDNYGTVNIVDVQSASTTLILFRLFEYLGIKIDKDIALSLLTGIYYDTGCLMHQNTNSEVFEVVSKLTEYGASAYLVAKEVFNTTPIETLKIWGKAMERMQLNNHGVAMSVLTNNDFKETGASTESLANLPDFLNVIKNSKFTMLLNEDGKGNVKGSFRTRRDDVDLNKFAAIFGGGGHKKASGFTLPGKLQQEVKWKIVPNEENLEYQKVNFLENKPELMVADSFEIPNFKKD